MRRTKVTLQQLENFLFSAALATTLEDKASYGGTFFVPLRARWNDRWTETKDDGTTEEHAALKHTQINIGATLNNAIAALEDENTALDGVLKGNINFNEEVAGNRDRRQHERGVKHARKNGVTLHLLGTALMKPVSPAK